MDPRKPRLSSEGLNLLLRPRPKHEISGQKGKKETIEPVTIDTLVYITHCQDCEITLQSPAVKIIVDRCEDMVIKVNSRLMSGLIEVISSMKVVLIIKEDVQVPTITVDNVKNMDIKIINQDQVQAIYSTDCDDLAVHVSGDDVAKYGIVPPNGQSDEQCISHWKERDGTRRLITEALERIGLYPATQEGRAEHERNREIVERKLDETLSGMFHQKGDPKK